MAIQLPALMVQDPNIFGRFAQGQQVANQNRLLDMNAQNQEFQQNRLTANDQFERQRYADSQSARKKQIEGRFYYKLAELYENTPPENWGEITQNAPIIAEHFGIEDAHELKDYAITPETIQTMKIAGFAQDLQSSDDPAAVKEYKYFSRLDKNQQAQYLRTKRAGTYFDKGDVRMAVDPVTGTTATPVQDAGTPQQSQEEIQKTLTTQAAAKAGEEASVKLDVELQKAPQVAAAIKQAEAQAAAFVNEGQKQKKDTAAYNVYRAGMGGLIAGLGGTETGPIAGRLPAVTTSQQIAEGAVAAMAPILKSMFRVAGEGTFTDKDQELLLNMVPTRKDTPEAITAKISNIDAIVNAKLGQANSQPRDNQPPPQTGTGNKRLRYNPQTGQLE